MIMRQPFFDDMRDRLLANVTATEIWPQADGSDLLPAVAVLRKSEWVPEFEKLMRQRVLMGAFRYELMAVKSEHFDYDLATEAIVRIERFIKTGNTEHLVDAGNMCMLEFEYSNHPNKHFASEDDGKHAERTK